MGTPLVADDEAPVAVEPLPTPVSAKQMARVTKAVQLLERWRDVRFADELELAPSSIILTTLGRTFYTGEQICGEALTNVLEGMVNFARSANTTLF
jgi:hypothetical protein